MAVASRHTGKYKRLRCVNNIEDIYSGCTVLLKSDISGYPKNDDGQHIVGDMYINSWMSKALGMYIKVYSVDSNDNTFTAIINGKWFWWPLEIIEYIVD